MEKQWFTETSKNSGSAFSLEIERKLHDEHTPHQRIEVFETTQFGNLMVIDDRIMLSARDNFIYHEMLVHPAMFLHPDPRKICIIGGGTCGILREVLTHPGVKKVSQVEIDERLACISEAYFPELCESNGDPRAKFVFEDGVAWMKEAKSDSQDVIIVPAGSVMQAESLASPEFYSDCFRVLREGGLLVQPAESPLLNMENLADTRASMSAAGAKLTRALFFPQMLYPSGWRSAIIGNKNKEISGFREKDLAKAKLKTRYYNAQIHQAAFAMPEFFRVAQE